MDATADLEELVDADPCVQGFLRFVLGDLSDILRGHNYFI